MITVSHLLLLSRRRLISAGALAVAIAVALGTFDARVEAQQPKTSAPPTPYTQTFVRDPKIPIDEEYTAKIKEYTTEPFFNSPLVDYLPASKTVPTPKAVLGDIAGAPGKLPYPKEVYEYMRMLEKATPAREGRTRIGKTEEGREMIAVAVASRSADGEARRESRRASPSSPIRARSTWTTPQAETLVAASTPIYYITGTIHSPETGAPTALMELAYRLAVDESRTSSTIRDNVITLITPVVEVDGRDRMVDIYKWHMAHPGQTLAEPGLLGQLRRARQQPRRDGRDAQAHARTCSTRTSTGRRRCCTTCTSRCRTSTTTPSATARTTRGSIRFSPTSGR